MYNESNALWRRSRHKVFEALEKPTDQALRKDPFSARLHGLSYRIDVLPTRQSQKSRQDFRVRIDGWEYSILNESRDYPVLSVSFSIRDDHTKLAQAILKDARLQSRRVQLNPHQSNRLMQMAFLMMKQIASGNVPDIDQMFHLYHLTPYASSDTGRRALQAHAGSGKRKYPGSNQNSLPNGGRGRN